MYGCEQRWRKASQNSMEAGDIIVISISMAAVVFSCILLLSVLAKVKQFYLEDYPRGFLARYLICPRSQMKTYITVSDTKHPYFRILDEYDQKIAFFSHAPANQGGYEKKSGPNRASHDGKNALLKNSISFV